MKPPRQYQTPKLAQVHVCNDGWICEQHPDRGWPHDECAGPGMPCPICQTDPPRLPNDWQSLASVRKVPDWRGTAVNIGELWRLTKGQHTAVCSLFNHPTRRLELRCIVDSETRESRADHDGLVLIDLAEEWKRQFLEKDWRP